MNQIVLQIPNGRQYIVQYKQEQLSHLTYVLWMMLTMLFIFTAWLFYS